MNYLKKIIENQKVYFKNKNEYLKTPKENLLKTVKNWSEIENDLGGGQGGELKPNNEGKVKFCSVRSSAALCVNIFAPFKENKFYDSKNFEIAFFEKKIWTGIKSSYPNLDFYLENENEIIGIESKFTEYFDEKIEHTNKNLSKYIDRRELNYLPVNFNENIIKFYVDKEEKMFLDVAQLIKHSMALIRESKMNKKPCLVYIYWQPNNYQEIEICQKHNKELLDFTNRISSFINFKHLTYNELFDEYENNSMFKEHFSLAKNRYSFCI